MCAHAVDSDPFFCFVCVLCSFVCFFLSSPCPLFFSEFREIDVVKLVYSILQGDESATPAGAGLALSDLEHRGFIEVRAPGLCVSSSSLRVCCFRVLRCMPVGRC